MPPPDLSPRALWRLVEPIHSVTYFAPAALETARESPLRGFWMAYFAQRAAPLGAVAAAPVAAACFGFHPDRVTRALPDAWSHLAPATALEVRAAGAVSALTPIWAATDASGAMDVSETADRLWAVAQAADTSGRVLAAANQALPRPGDPIVRLWQACTTLREHRGDGHVAVLVARGVSPLAAHLIKTGAGEIEDDYLRQARGFSEEQWSRARAELVARGWLDVDGLLTDDGWAEHDAIESATDAAAAQPWATLDPDELAELHAGLVPLTAAVLAAGLLPDRNPVGLGDLHAPTTEGPGPGGPVVPG